MLVDNFNNVSNLQGTGTTIVDYNPATKKAALFAKLPQKSAGVSRRRRSDDGDGGAEKRLGDRRQHAEHRRHDADQRRRLLAGIDANGQLVTAWADPNINGPWGNMAVIDNGAAVTLFVSMAGFDVPGPQVLDPATGFPVTINKATVVRMQLTIPAGKPPAVTDETIVAVACRRAPTRTCSWLARPGWR